ncbi:NYN domain-containing protein [Corynebacterium sp. ED61]|uniref:NYN domain-containing protein n=1 Tax=Corynebacterium sp. ED61 TaxID=2211360 RepID=UPI0018833282|nr:NYN domain-containing protein [Corynebacterium sp. ED61]MBF0582440.1 NYN domain-containing protein [Corynebacterium sp. ED61]
MLERTLIFVDTSYLLASFYNSWDTGARAQLEIDLPEVVSVLGRMGSEQLKQQIHRQYWYDGIPDSGPHRYQRSLRSEPGVQLRAGQLIEWGDRRTQKAVDTRLVADMVLTAMKGHVSDIILVSGDADMLPGVEEAVNAGVRVHLYGFGWDSMSSALRFACDTTTILDPREDFRDTMRLQVLEGPVQPTVSPSAEIERPLGDAEQPEEPGLSPIPVATTGTSVAAEVSSSSDATSDSSASGPSLTDSAKAAANAAADPAAPSDDAAGQPAADASVTGESAAREVTPQEAYTQESASRPESAEPDSAAQETAQPEQPAADKTADSESAADETGLASKTTQVPTPGTMPRPNPGMMARHRKLRSRYVPLPNEVWASSGEQNPLDIGQQYAVWWYDNGATEEQKDSAHLLSGGGLPPEIDRPLLQFACETLHEYTLTEAQRVGLRDGFHAGIRSIMLRR